MEIDKTIGDNMGAIQEMVQSMKAVKGEKFTLVALHVFESLQLQEMACALASCDPAKDGGYIEDLLNCFARIAGSMTSKLTRGMDDGEIDEALKMGESLMERKEYLQNQLSNKQ